ncbi:MAG: hypothetical protein RI883_1723 [Bacteroidota bacterium]|jgi:hypothetical protein
MIFNFFSVAALSLVLFSCNNATKETPVTKIETTEESEHHHDASTEIELNKGEKWTVDKNMMVHIRNMEKDVRSFTKHTKNDYDALSKKLLANIDLLTSNCTMTGKAHDELHKWLLPYIDLANDFSEAKDIKNQENCYHKLEESFDLFNTYFN